MEMMRLSQVAEILGVSFTDADVAFENVCTDSRAIQKRDLFVALIGERFDGHAFVSRAKEQGAVAAIVNKQHHAECASLIRCVAVEDTRLALGKLASSWRERFAIPLVALTGSSGKTTVKEMLAAILRRVEINSSRAEILATQGNLNNDIGVPLTLFRLRTQHQFAVVEMGMSHQGEIGYLSQLSKPNVAIIINAGRAHLAGLGSLEAIARAKGEIFEGLAADGVAVINRDDAFSGLWRELAHDRRVVDFGMQGDAMVSARATLDVDSSQIELKTPTESLNVSLNVPGVHNVYNALAAAAGAKALNISLETIAQGLSDFHGHKGRLEIKPCVLGAKLIDDTYNANPESVRAAIAVLARATGKKILVLGDMGELGVRGREFHAEIGAEAKCSGIDVLLTLGDLSSATSTAFGSGARHFERMQELLAEIENLLAPNVTLLVKGSRFMQMERVVKSFTPLDENTKSVANGDYRH